VREEAVMVKVEAYCTRCDGWHETEITEEQETAMSRDCNPICELCPKCQHEADIEFDMRYPHLGCCGH
jgi:hypothetical protein